ncbi:MAG: single-stranded DNA-binding protein [Chloroflexi bacterium]|nr:single-stranded DNA-binding protein [Chloroflexota bacterium]
MDQNDREARPSVEFSARTEEEALALASQELHCPPEQLEYQVVRDSTRTILGLVRTGEVTIRVWLPQPTASAPEQVGEPVRREDVASEAPPKTLEGVTEAILTKEPEVERKEESVESRAKLEETAIEIVSTLLDKMGILAAVEVAEREGPPDPATGEATPLVLNVVGDDLGGLVGRRGETLRDLQFIVRLMISRRLGHWPNIVIDVEGYKARRETTLRDLALRMRDQVKRTGRTVVLEPMPANERRIVHLTLRDDPDVYTESTGEEDHRKVQIIPR